VITNALAPEEFESILKSILRLESIESIFNTIYRLFHLPIDKKPYTTKTENGGILTTYKTFKFEIKHFIYVESDSSEHPRILLGFTKRKTFWDDFVNPTNKIVSNLKKLSASEIPDLQFDVLSTDGFGHEDLRILYQKGTYNPDWEKQHRISPLIIFKTIFKEKGQEYYVIEYSLVAECFQRKGDKTILKEGWKEIFRYSAPYWL
jgi:hypothetical protein